MDDISATQSRTPTKDEGVCIAIVTLIAEFEGVGPETVPPLAKSIDPDALDRLFAPASASAYPELAFRHHGYHVYVNNNRQIVVQQLE